MFDAYCYEKQLKDMTAKLDNIWRILEGKSILVTGATGLIGSAVVDLLCFARKAHLADVEVYAASRSLIKLQQRFKVWEDLCFLEYEAVHRPQWNRKFDCIIHCAGNAHPAEFGKHPVETVMEGIEGIYYLLDYVKRTGSRSRTLYVSSSEVYGIRDSGCGEWYSEEDFGRVDFLKARACYPSAKRTAETLCASFVQEYGLDVVIARPGHIYGPNVTDSDSRAFAQFFRDVMADRDIVMKSEGNQLRSYCYVLDCASALLTILSFGETGKAYNVSNKESVVTIRQLAEEIAKQSGRSIVNVKPTDLEERSRNFMELSALNAKSLEALGWCGHYDLQAGVRATLEALRR